MTAPGHVRLSPEASKPASAALWTTGVVVPCKDEVGTLERCLRSLRATAPTCIVVVDNGSTDGSLDVARSLADLVLEVDGTISAVRNAGAAALPPVDVVGFVDADCEVAPAWLSAGLSALEDADLVGARTDAPADAPWVARRWAAVEATRAHDASRVWSQHLLVRRSVFEQLGGFDESLPTGEDADLSARVVAAGGRVRLVPAMSVVHHGFPRDLRGFLRRELWHTRAPGWFDRMAPGSRALVLVAAAWAGVGAAAAIVAAGGRTRPVATWLGASAAAVPALGALGGGSARHSLRDGVLLTLWVAVRVGRLPRERRVRPVVGRRGSAR